MDCNRDWNKHWMKCPLAQMVQMLFLKLIKILVIFHTNSLTKNPTFSSNKSNIIKKISFFRLTDVDNLGRIEYLS